MKFWQIVVILLAVIALLFVLSQQEPVQPTPTSFTNAELAGNSPAIGQENAKVTIVEFSDYQCPGCLAAEQSARQILQSYSGKIRFVYRNFPLYDIHPNAGIAAEAALAAREQGKFWEMHNALFDEQEQVRESGTVAIEAIARQLGLDENKFNDALESHEFAAAVKAEFDDAVKFGCEGTPTFFINGTKYFGAYSAEQLKQIIDAELTK